MENNLIEFKPKLEKILINVADGFDEFIPESGKTAGAVLRFKTPCEWARVCFYDVSRDPSAPRSDIRLLYFGAMFSDDSERVMKNIVLKGSKAEIIGYLKSSECLEDTIRSIEKFDEKIRLHD